MLKQGDEWRQDFATRQGKVVFRDITAGDCGFWRNPMGGKPRLALLHARGIALLFLRLAGVFAGT
jgi:hypothetical protein